MVETGLPPTGPTVGGAWAMGGAPGVGPGSARDS